MKIKNSPKRIIMILLLISIFFGLFLTTSLSYSYWAKTIKGTNNNLNNEFDVGYWKPTYLIETSQDLIDSIPFVKLDDPEAVEAAKDINITLKNNITLDLTEADHENLGNFYGNFDGGGHTITAIVDGTDPNHLANGGKGFGLFGDVANSGTIKNLNVEICMYYDAVSDDGKGNYYFGGLAAFNYGVIENVHVYKKEGCLNGGLTINLDTTERDAHFHVGGLVGENKGMIINSSSAVDIHFTHKFILSGIINRTVNMYVGGLVGKNVYDPTISLAGTPYANQTAHVLNSSSTGNIQVFADKNQLLGSLNASLGGIIGHSDLKRFKNEKQPGHTLYEFTTADLSYNPTNTTNNLTVTNISGRTYTITVNKDHILVGKTEK